MYHDPNMEGTFSNVYKHSNGSITRAQTKQLQKTLISQISVIKAWISLEACELNKNNSNIFVGFQIKLES
jgi:hypothetical protein